MIKTWYSPLDFAIINGQYDAAKYLLTQGAKLKVVDSTDDYDNTLGYATRYGEGKKFVELVYNTRESDLNKVSMQEAIDEAIMYGNIDAFKFLFNKSCEKGDDFQADLLNLACVINVVVPNYREDIDMQNDIAIEMINILLSSGVDVNGGFGGNGENYGRPLSDAAESGNVNKVKLLISKGADVNACPKFEDGYTGYSPLTTAVIHGNFSIVKILIENGAKIDNPSEEFGEAKNLLNLAKDAGSERIYEYLLSVSREQEAVDSGQVAQ
jgi:ankyrin repeat protein